MCFLVVLHRLVEQAVYGLKTNPKHALDLSKLHEPESSFRGAQRIDDPRSFEASTDSFICVLVKAIQANWKTASRTSSDVVAPHPHPQSKMQILYNCSLMFPKQSHMSDIKYAHKQHPLARASIPTGEND